MSLLVGDQTSRQWVTDLIYVLLEAEEYEYAFTLHNVNVISVNKPFALCNGIPIAAGVCMSSAMRVNLLLYYPLVSRLSHRSQLAMFKHELLHIVEGHMSSYGERLIDEYGPDISNIGKDLYVNQRLTKEEIDSLAEDGYPLHTIAKYGFKKGLSSEEYCQLLQTKASQGKADIPAQDIEIVQSDGAVEPGEPGEPGEPFAGQGQMQPTEVFDLSKDEGLLADQATREVLRSITEALESRGLKWREERGFGGADRGEFIEASKRHSRVPWHYYLRVMESRLRTEEVVPTRSRLSRRCAHHMGRVRRNGLDVAFAIDTSGSMQADQLSLVDAELRGMHTRGAHITVIHCDADIAKVEDYSPFMTMETFHGRGGTDFSPALLYTWDMYPSPSMFVCFTDGAGCVREYVARVKQEYGEEWYEEFAARRPSTTPDGIEALWLIPEGCMEPEAFSDRICPWGQVIVVPSEQESDV